MRCSYGALCKAEGATLHFCKTCTSPFHHLCGGEGSENDLCRSGCNSAPPATPHSPTEPTSTVPEELELKFSDPRTELQQVQPVQRQIKKSLVKVIDVEKSYNKLKNPVDDDLPDLESDELKLQRYLAQALEGTDICV